MLILVLIFINGCHSYKSTKCGTETCVGHYHLQHSKGITLNLTGTKFSGEINVIPKTITGHLVDRRRYYNYYYNGGNIDPNTGGYSTYDRPPISDDELMKWVIDGKCRYGKVCCPNGDCYGSDAKHCLEPERNIILNEAKNREFECAGKTWSIFAKHTCVLDWACYIKEFSFPLHICGENICTSYPNGTDLVIDVLGKEQIQRVTLLDGSQIIFTHESRVLANYKKVKCNMNCYPLNHDKALCVVSEGCELSNTILRTCTPGLFCSRTEFILEKAMRKEQSDNIHRIRRSSDKAVSKLDLDEITVYFQAEILRNDLNIIKMAKHVNYIEDILLKMITYLGYNDAHIIGQVMGRNLITKYISEDQFTTCPCYNKEVRKEEICSKGNESYWFTSGTFQPWNKKTKCFKPSQNSSAIQLIKDYIYYSNDLREPDVVGASFEWEGWQWMAENREKILDSILVASTVSNSPVYDYLGSVITNPVYTIWNSVVAHSGIIALGLSVFNFLRR